MADGIDISFAEVSRTAESIRTINGSLKDKLNEVKTQMNNLNNSWQSEAGTTIRNNFNKFSAKFDEHFEVIQAYSKFLDHTVSEYTANETRINNNADKFR
ncbi:WXG100 family type VII secretion target [Paenibacillus pinisoli]|uniref:WXG100 family type VII secretion target n=1 Tax=Paenibacillus pinisoli TaxID=1276110 RepID=A0A3A6PTR2_9BACL|nr:pore-forming ESAT-6 family protein [Paenibacillus pinisoli]RJX39133.1 WXG100 family type VII secretion target [Paenibacillus pinisoli]